MNREPVAPLPDVERMIRESNSLIRELAWWRWRQALLLATSVFLGVLTLSWKVRDEVFGRTAIFRSDGVHAPQYTRGEFEQEFTLRVRERGFTVESLRIISHNDHNQFELEITLLRVPSSISKYDVLNQLRQVSESMKDKALPVEK